MPRYQITVGCEGILTTNLPLRVHKVVEKFYRIREFELVPYMLSYVNVQTRVCQHRPTII